MLVNQFISARLGTAWPINKQASNTDGVKVSQGESSQTFARRPRRVAICNPVGNKNCHGAVLIAVKYGSCHASNDFCLHVCGCTRLKVWIGF